MLNIIKSELFKTFHRKCTYVFLIVFGIGGFFMNLLLHVMMTNLGQAEKFGDNVIEFWIEVVITFGWFLIYMIAQMVHSNESKLGVLKNSISFGITRTHMYVGRFLAQLIMLVLSVVFVSGMVLFGNLVFNGGCSAKIFGEFVEIIAVMGVLWIGALSLAHALAMALNSNTMATVIYILYFMIGYSILDLVHSLLPHNQIVAFMSKYEIYSFARNTVMTNAVDKNLSLFFAIGGAYLVVSFVIGVFVYQRKEVK